MNKYLNIYKFQVEVDISNYSFVVLFKNLWSMDYNYELYFTIKIK